MGYSMILSDDTTDAEETVACTIAHDMKYDINSSPDGWKVEKVDHLSWNIYHGSKYIANVIV